MHEIRHCHPRHDDDHQHYVSHRHHNRHAHHGETKTVDFISFVASIITFGI
jgi:hypothetical protein